MRELLRRFLAARPTGRRLLAFARRRHDLKFAVAGRLVAPSFSTDCSVSAEGRRETLRLGGAAQLVGGTSAWPHPWSDGVFESVPRSLVCLQDAHLLEVPGVVLSRCRRLRSENLHGRRRTVLEHRPLRLVARTFGPVAERFDAVFVLLGPYSYNYFHWLNDHLPRVELFLELRPMESGLKLLVPRWLNGFQQQSLAALGVRDDEIVQMSGGHSRARRAFIASHPGFELDGLPAAGSRVAWVRERVLERVIWNHRRSDRRLFVSRRDVAEPPRIRNEEEIARALERRGFEVVVLSRLPFDDQVRLFAEAGVVVAAHGAGLANLMFSRKPGVVELARRGHLRPDFAALTQIAGGRHRLVIAEGETQSGFVVDPGEVEIAIAEVAP